MSFDDPKALLQMLLDAVMHKNYALVASVFVMLNVLAFRKGAVPLIVKLFPKLGFLQNKVVTVLVALLSPVVGALITALVAGQPFTVGLVLSALMSGLAGVGLFSAGKNIAEGVGLKAEKVPERSDEEALKVIVGGQQ